jgi:hypothetical protein
MRTKIKHYPMVDKKEGLKISDTKNIGKNEIGREYLLSMQVSVTLLQYEFEFITCVIPIE